VDELERTWITACLGGDKEAFRHLVTRYQGPLYRIAWRILGERTAAHDVAQETFLKAYQALDRYDPSRPFSSWLYRICVNVSIDRRRRSREVAIAELDPPHLHDPTASIESAEAQRAVQACLQRLPDNYRVVLVLKDIEGLDYESITQVLGDSIPALKIRVVRGRARLAQLIRKLYPELLPAVALVKKAL
jgi:RNA polymerase sigma-70 factor, ECF subfamily